MRIGLISDTHGLFDPLLPRLFDRCDLILHAGDVVKQSVLDALERVAPLRAVRGNNDLGPLGDSLPEIAVVSADALTVLVVHQLPAPERPAPQVRREIARRGARLVVYGHSHRPLVKVVDGLLYVNPGSAGPRRFSLPRTAGLLDVAGRRAEVSLFLLDGPAPRPLGQRVHATL